MYSKQKRFSTPSVPPPLQTKCYASKITSLNKKIAKCSTLILSLPSLEYLYILKLREAFLSTFTQDMKVKFEDLFAITSSEKKSFLIKRASDYLKAIDYIDKLTHDNKTTISFWEKLHSFVESHYNKPANDIGRIRVRQNWIGPKNCREEQAFFYPPPPENLHHLLDELNNYIDDTKDPLIQLGVAFAQFLIIHPFMDGNGRVARLLPCYIFKKKGLLPSAFFSLTEYFLVNRLKYLKNLYLLTSKQKWKVWFNFYLRGVEEDLNHLYKNLISLHRIVKRLSILQKMSLSSREIDKITRFLLCNPVFTPSIFKKKTKLPPSKYRKIIAALVFHKILVKEKGAVYRFKALINLGQKRGPVF
jgi:Fic family protein